MVVEEGQISKDKYLVNSPFNETPAKTFKRVIFKYLSSELKCTVLFTYQSSLQTVRKGFISSEISNKLKYSNIEFVCAYLSDYSLYRYSL